MDEIINRCFISVFFFLYIFSREKKKRMLISTDIYQKLNFFFKIIHNDFRSTKHTNS